MVAGTADRSDLLRIVDGKHSRGVTWARALVSRQWRHDGAPGHGGWGRRAQRDPEATFLKCWFWVNFERLDCACILVVARLAESSDGRRASNTLSCTTLYT